MKLCLCHVYIYDGPYMLFFLFISSLRYINFPTLRICTGNSRPQNQAIAGAVQQEVRENFSEKFKVRGNGAPEGSAESGWIILDYGDIMVHVMTPRSRLYFDIEGKWKGKGAAYVDITSWLTLDPTSSFPAARQMDEASNDPFWS